MTTKVDLLHYIAMHTEITPLPFLRKALSLISAGAQYANFHSYPQKPRSCRFPDSPLAVALTLVRAYLVFFSRSANTKIGNRMRNRKIYISILQNFIRHAPSNTIITAAFHLKRRMFPFINQIKYHGSNGAKSK